MSLTTDNVRDNIGKTGFGLDSAVFLEFSSGQIDSDNALTNRIMLRVPSISISTNKRASSQPIPFSGIVTGQSRSVMIDLGTATKSIQISGAILHDQIISRRYGDEDPINVVMTGYEVAQLLHSAIDSSFVQPNQHISKMVILFPSRVGKDYTYHTGVSADTNLEDLPLIPFTWNSRTKDEANSVPITHFPTLDTDLFEIDGIAGFIDNFSTTFNSGGIVTIDSLTFQETINIDIF